MKHAPALLFSFVAAAPVAAQELRRALVDADLVAVAKAAGKVEHGEVALHRLVLTSVVRGPAATPTAVTVVDWPKLSLHNRPSPAQSRLYCLVSAERDAQRLGLPADRAPFYKMVGWSGSNPLVGADVDHDPVVALARTFADAERGADAGATANALLDMALGAEPAVRLEAARYLAERPLLRRRLSPLQWSAVMSRMSAESDDVELKIALAELCAEQRVDGLGEALILGLGSVRDLRFATTVGRLSAWLSGDDCVAPLLQRWQTSGNKDERAAILLALGATRTGPALDALLQIRQAGGADAAALDAALREHSSKRALDAVLQGRPDKGAGK